MPETDDPPIAKASVIEPLLPASWQTPKGFRERLGDDVGRQRLMDEEGHLLLVLHSPPKPNERLRRGRLFWRDPTGTWKPAPIQHVEHPVGELVAEYEAVADELDRQHDDATAAKDYFAVLRALTPLVRSASNLEEALAEARGKAKGDRALILLRDRAYALARRMKLLQQDAQNTLDYVIARRAEEQAEAATLQARAAHRLNVLAALFFPVATLMTFFSSSLGHGLEEYGRANAPWPLLAVLVIGLVLGGLLVACVTRK